MCTVAHVRVIRTYGMKLKQDVVFVCVFPKLDRAVSLLPWTCCQWQPGVCSIHCVLLQVPTGMIRSTCTFLACIGGPVLHVNMVIDEFTELVRCLCGLFVCLFVCLLACLLVQVFACCVLACCVAFVTVFALMCLYMLLCAVVCAGLAWPDLPCLIVSALCLYGIS